MKRKSLKRPFSTVQKNDKYFYDGKIVNYGDMGGTNDHEFMEVSKNLMKELQSDGFLNKPLNIPDGEGGWEVKDLKLEGRPCLTYTTVPNHDFDEQEMSRSIFITPRMDNKEIFNRRNRLLEFKHGRIYNTLKKYENEAEMVPYMLLHLKEESISANLAPKAADVLNDIRNNIDDWRMQTDEEILDMGITTNIYFTRQNLGLSKDSVKKYMYKLEKQGFLQINGHLGNSNVYDLANSEIAHISYDLKHIDDSVYDDIRYEIGEWVVELMNEDRFVEGLSIMNFDSEVENQFGQKPERPKRLLEKSLKSPYQKTIKKCFSAN